jgi:hypothetical protein
LRVLCARRLAVVPSLTLSLSLATGLAGCRPSGSDPSPSRERETADVRAASSSAGAVADASLSLQEVRAINGTKARRSANTTRLVAAAPDTDTFYQTEMKSVSEWRLLAFRGAEEKGRVVASQFDPITSIAALGRRVCWTSGREVTCKESETSPARNLASTADERAPHRLSQTANPRHVAVDGTSVYFVETHKRDRDQGPGGQSDALVQVKLGEPRSHVLFEGELLDAPPVRVPEGLVFAVRTPPRDACRLVRFSFETGRTETLATLPNGKPVGLFADASSFWVGLEDGVTGGDDLVLRVPRGGGEAQRVTRLVDHTPGWGVLASTVVLSPSETRVELVAADGSLARTVEVGPFDRLVVTKNGWLFHRADEDVWRKPPSGQPGRDR